MKYRFAILIFAIAFILQTSVFGQLQIAGASANLILCCGVVISFTYTETNAGIIVGAITAMIYDIAFSPFIGMTALPLAIVMGIAVFVREFLLNRERMVAMLSVAAGTVIIYYHLYFVMVKISGFASSYVHMLGSLVIYFVLDVIIMMILYIFMIEKATARRDNGYLKWAR